MIINEGGNVTGTVKKTKENTRAQKIPIKEIGRQNLLKNLLNCFIILIKDLKKSLVKSFGKKKMN